MKTQSTQTLTTLTQSKRLDILKEAFQTTHSDSISQIYATAQKICTQRYPSQRIFIRQQHQR